MIDAAFHLWHHVERLGNRYGVDPIVFGMLYLSHHPLFWGTMAWLAARARRKKPIRLQVTLGVVFWFMPYAYVFLFGHGLPAWAWAIAVVFVAVGGTHMVRKIRRRIINAHAMARGLPGPVA